MSLPVLNAAGARVQLGTSPSTQMPAEMEQFFILALRHLAQFVLSQRASSKVSAHDWHWADTDIVCISFVFKKTLFRHQFVTKCTHSPSWCIHTVASLGPGETLPALQSARSK